MAYPRDVSIADAIKSYYQLPQTHRVHWSKARKDQVVRAVRSQAISLIAKGPLLGRPQAGVKAYTVSAGSDMGPLQVAYLM